MSEGPTRYQSIIDVHIILERGREVLLTERRGTRYFDGMFHLPSGHLEEGETLVDGAVREAREEVGVRIEPAALRLVTVVHHRHSADHARVGTFFATDRWAGEPYNAEPDKCGKLLWCDPSALPSNTIAYCAAGIRAYLEGAPFTASGCW